MVALLAYSSSSYSEQVFGTTQNAASSSYNWVMQNILPQQAGLTVSNVIYRYNAIKEVQDDMIVYVQNEDALGDGYVFREEDDWSGLPGTGIRKVIPVGAIPLQRWGDGSIEIQGEGSVENASVTYTYQYDPCFDPQSDPSCPDYQVPYNLEDIIPVIEFEDPLQDEFIRAEMEKKAKLEREKEQEEYERKKLNQKVKVDLEKMLGGLNMQMMNDSAILQEQALFALNYIPKSYLESIDGREYNDVLKFEQKEISDNRKARRAIFAQQLKHEKMLELQYDN